MLGQTDPGEMMENMTEKTFRLWQLYFLNEPFGPGVDAVSRAVMAAAACHSDDWEAFLPMTSEG